MSKFLALLFAALVPVVAQADVDNRDYSRRTDDNVRNSATVFADAAANYANRHAGQRGNLVGVPDLRMGTVSATVLYPGAAFTQFSFVFPDNVRAVRIGTNGGSGTNFCHVGWSSSLTGSAPTGGTIEAYQHLPRISGKAAGTNVNGRYEWVNLQTRPGFSTLFCGCTDTAAIGVNGIRVEYIKP